MDRWKDLADLIIATIKPNGRREITGQSLQDTLLSIGDTAEQELADAIEPIKETEELIKQEEEKRKEAETLRNQAEAERETAETLRNQAEAERETAETLRNQAEAERETAETLRNQAEAERETAETLRNQAEAERETAETLRNQAEAEREEDTATAIRKTEEAAEKAIEAAENIESELAEKQDKEDNTLQTENKTVVGGINENHETLGRYKEALEKQEDITGSVLPEIIAILKTEADSFKRHVVEDERHSIEAEIFANILLRLEAIEKVLNIKAI